MMLSEEFGHGLGGDGKVAGTHGSKRPQGRNGCLSQPSSRDVGDTPALTRRSTMALTTYESAAPVAVAAPPPKGGVVDLFCGAGALSHGFLLEGFSVVCGYDTDDTCQFPFETNNDASFIRADVTSLTGNQVAARFPRGLPRILAGCAPCQPFSLYSRGREDPKWALLGEFARLAIEARPEIVTMENVPQLVRFKGGQLFKDFVAALEGAGYSVRSMTAYCPDFGVPQARSRLVVVASRLGRAPLPTPTHPKGRHVSVADAIGGMPPLKAGEMDATDPLHRTSRLSKRNLERMRASRPGGTWRDWSRDLVTRCHRRESGHGYVSVYGRMGWNAPSPTITTQFYGFGNGRFGHPEQDRALSLREGAILQTFPENYAFVPPGARVTIKDIGRMIGNAVPVALARAIARAIADHLEEA